MVRLIEFPYQKINQSLPSYEYEKLGEVPAPAYSQDTLVVPAVVPLEELQVIVKQSSRLTFLILICLDPYLL